MTSDKLVEECGVFGVIGSSKEAAGITYNALLALQHRGQEGAGIAILEGNSISCYKDTGLVNEVFTPDKLENVSNSAIAIGHVRYSTTGTNTKKNVQPIVTEYLKGRIATAHNGNIINASDLKKQLESYGCDFSATSDSEVISSLIAYEALQRGNIEEAVKAAVGQLRGAFSLVIMTSKKKLIAVRDPWGFRPLCLGKNQRGYAIASESCALDSAGFKFVRDIEPGEMVIIDEEQNVKSQIIMKSECKGLCIFEHVYFARTDSFLDGLSVYQSRFNMGVNLAKEFPVDADIVCGVPDSGIESAMGYAKESGLPYVAGFVKNRYIGRSFIFPSQEQRETAVMLKLNPLKFNVEGKKIVLIDDSIVRGTTCARIIKILKAAGAKEIHMRISSPPFKHTCHFGTDVDNEENLIANKMSIDEIAKSIGADSLGFISPEGLLESCKDSKLTFCTGCFSGNYPIDLGAHTKQEFENRRYIFNE